MNQATARTDLCKGFAISRADQEKQCVMETLFALLLDGRVLECEEAPRSAMFDKPGSTWKLSEHGPEWLKENAEFIGNYTIPQVK